MNKGLEAAIQDPVRGGMVMSNIPSLDEFCNNMTKIIDERKKSKDPIYFIIKGYKFNNKQGSLSFKLESGRWVKISIIDFERLTGWNVLTELQKKDE